MSEQTKTNQKRYLDDLRRKALRDELQLAMLEGAGHLRRETDSRGNKNNTIKRAPGQNEMHVGTRFDGISTCVCASSRIKSGCAYLPASKKRTPGTDTPTQNMKAKVSDNVTHTNTKNNMQHTTPFYSMNTAPGQRALAVLEQSAPIEAVGLRAEKRSGSLTLTLMLVLVMSMACTAGIGRHGGRGGEWVAIGGRIARHNDGHAGAPLVRGHCGENGRKASPSKQRVKVRKQN